MDYFFSPFKATFFYILLYSYTNKDLVSYMHKDFLCTNAEDVVNLDYVHVNISEGVRQKQSDYMCSLLEIQCKVLILTMSLSFCFPHSASV